MKRGTTQGKAQASGRSLDPVVLNCTTHHYACDCREEMFRRARETHERAMVWSLKSDSQMRLDCGELTAHEIRAIRAVLKSIIQNPSVLPPAAPAGREQRVVGPEN